MTNAPATLARALPLALLLTACGRAPASPQLAPPPTATEPAADASPGAPDATHGGDQAAALGQPDSAPAPPAAPIEAAIEARSGAKLHGSIALTPAEGGGVKITVTLEEASPGKHGLHLHEKADCSAPDGKSAGGHLNPDGVDHGLPPAKRHLGDLGNIEIGPDGSGRLEITVAEASLKRGDAHSVLGRAVIVHAKPDDGGQPTGNAGGRIGCGVIAASE